MRYALIDNSTLTSVQRILGEIQVNSKSIIDNDIIAFENYIQAILFYDDLICIDDYKDEYKSKRAQSFPNVRMIPKSFFDYDRFNQLASEVTNDIVLEIRSGKITDKDFKDYFDRLQMTFQFTWDMSSSNFFLTQKMLLGKSMLNKEEFSKMHSYLFKEHNEHYESASGFADKIPKLYDKDGNEIKIDGDGKIRNSADGDGISWQFKALVSSLNWMSHRTAFYSLAAEYLHADLFIQPIRQSFLQNIISRVYPNYSLGVFNNLRNAINLQGEETLKNVLATSDNFALSFNIPLFSAYFAKKTEDSKMIIEAAMNERNNKEFFEARTKLRELNMLLDTGNRGKCIREINLLRNDINKCFLGIEGKYGLGKEQGMGNVISHLTFLFSYIAPLDRIKLPEMDLRIKQLEFMKHIYPKKGLNAVYRNVVEELIEFNRIGKYKDILIKNVRFTKDATFYEIKTEDPRYVNASSYWKKPMK